ncbi:urease accessory protein UreE [Candidatus Poribacteria bacterium]|nr:urease accessory protein UreE [Candidatus Poribacteria bacterium]
MILVESVLPKGDDGRRERDVAPLTWEGRCKARHKVATRAGREVGLALRTGTVLHPGDVLYRDDRLVIEVGGVPERMFVLAPATTADACLCCYQIGNLHRPIALDGPRIVTPYERALEAAIKRIGVPFEIDERVFTHAAPGGPARHAH